MGKRSMVFMVVICVAFMFAAGTIFAGTEVKDEFMMQNKAYDKHTKAIVNFTHKKHAEDYQIGCGDCHHDDKGQPLDLKMGDDVQSCIDCHKIPGQMPGAKKKEMRAAKASKDEIKAEKMKYHAEAIHANCITCHKAHNKKNKTKAAPASCSKCHPKKK